jgi:uncharacterized protein GlcG (DUF336 family)
VADLTLTKARAIIRGALKHARANDLQPLGVVVLDAGGNLKAFEREDGASIYRFRIAHGKAHGAIGLGMGGRAIHKRAEEQAYFPLAVAALEGTALVPVPGGVLVRDRQGRLIGAVGISGDKSDADEAAATAGIEAAGLAADP